jgi:hypothetical protein
MNKMEKFLIEVPHEGDVASCSRAVRDFLASGSHFVTNAEWGCKDGNHKAWLIIEAENRDEAIRILPPAYKVNAIVTQLNKFTRKDMQDTLEGRPLEAPKN